MQTAMRRALRGVAGVAFRRGCASVFASALLLAATAPAFGQAQPGSVADTAATARVSQLYNDGVNAAKNGDWKTAYESFLAAWKIRQHPQLAANLGRAELNLGKHRDAAEHLAYFLREAKGIGKNDQAMARLLLNQAKRRVATVTVTVTRPGAEVLVDGLVVGVSPLAGEVFIEPGAHRFEARVGAVLGAPVIEKMAVGGLHEVELEVNVPAQVEAPEEASTGPSTAVLVAGGAITGAAVIAGVVFTLGANERVRKVRSYPDYDQCYVARAAAAPGNCAEIDAEQRDANLFSNLAFWSFIGAGAVGVTTVAYALFSPRRATAMGTWMAPVATAGGAGVSVGGRW
jgi:hypothetical protein